MAVHEKLKEIQTTLKAPKNYTTSMADSIIETPRGYMRQLSLCSTSLA